MVDSKGSRSRIARSTVSPPTPESKTPIGLWSPTSLLFGRHQPVSQPGHRLQVDTGGAEVAELLAQALDVGVDGVVVDLGQVAPDLLQELGPAQHPARVGRQQG